MIGRTGDQLGILLSATPGAEAYVTYGDTYTLIPDGYIVSMARTKVWYTNGDCTGTPYVAEGAGYEPIANFVYEGYFDRLYVASTTVYATGLALGSYAVDASCIGVSIAPKVHAATLIGSARDLYGSMPWHIVMQ